MTSIRDRFIVSDELGQKKLELLAERMLPFCKVTKSGKVILEKRELKSKDRVGVAVVAKYLANKFDPEISSQVTAKEISDDLLIPRNQVDSRLKNLKDDKVIKSIKRGVFEADPTRIESYIKGLENSISETG